MKMEELQDGLFKILLILLLFLFAASAASLQFSLVFRCFALRFELFGDAVRESFRYAKSYAELFSSDFSLYNPLVVYGGFEPPRQRGIAGRNEFPSFRHVHKTTILRVSAEAFQFIYDCFLFVHQSF